jgi:protein-L-isoaspartate(D-aspartate) O-methyltransferase
MRSIGEHYQDQLATTVQVANPAISAAVIEAFRTIPRHPFVETYYLHDEDDGRLWTKRERDDSVACYEQIYQDEALVTRVDQYGRTLSSSSQPSIMAAMLEALELRPGMRVLEIGTGSGYNAALLAHLTGDPRLVTTIDLDTEVIARARRCLPQVVGEGMTIVEADGALGYASGAPYDRIIVTASVAQVPAAWLEQLAEDGVLISILQPRYARLGGLLRAHKRGEEFQGKLLQAASFMPLRAAGALQRPIRPDVRASVFASFPCDRRLFPPLFLHTHHDFAFFLACDLPDLSVFRKDEALFVSQEALPEGYVVLREDSACLVTLRGDRVIACALWNRLVRAFSLWEHLERPAIAQYAFEMHKSGQALSLQTHLGRIWPFGFWTAGEDGNDARCSEDALPPSGGND